MFSLFFFNWRFKCPGTTWHIPSIRHTRWQAQWMMSTTWSQHRQTRNFSIRMMAKIWGAILTNERILNRKHPAAHFTPQSDDEMLEGWILATGFGLWFWNFPPCALQTGEWNSYIIHRHNNSLSPRGYWYYFTRDSKAGFGERFTFVCAKTPNIRSITGEFENYIECN